MAFFAQLCQKLQCYSSLLPLEHIALSIHIGQPEPPCVWLSLLYFDDGPIKSEENPSGLCERISRRGGKSDSGWNMKWLQTPRQKKLQCLRCKQMCHCIPVTLKVEILLKVKQSPDDVDKSSYYWLYSVKCLLLNVHLEVQLKAFTVSPPSCLKKGKQQRTISKGTDTGWILVWMELPFHYSNLRKYKLINFLYTSKAWYLKIVH